MERALGILNHAAIQVRRRAPYFTETHCEHAGQVEELLALRRQAQDHYALGWLHGGDALEIGVELARCSRRIRRAARAHWRVVTEWRGEELGQRKAS
eukprot:8136971-Pyramimonas_sp.AAC.1